MLNCTLGRITLPRVFFRGPCLRRVKKGMETLYAYLAGAIDTRGRISISRDRGYRRGSREMAYYSAVISLSDSDPVLPDLLQATFPARRLQYEAKNRSHRAWAYVGSSGPKGTRATHSAAALSPN